MSADRADKGLAFITGASTGMGLELARCAAAARYDLIIVSDGPDILATSSVAG